jgi:hypothetical protein
MYNTIPSSLIWLNKFIGFCFFVILGLVLVLIV